MPIRLSYINARGEEVVLDDDEHSFAYELVGRTGFEMPGIDTETVDYGDGTQDIIVSRLKNRTVTCYFWVDLDDKVEFERHLREVKSKLVQVGSRMGNWGKLKIRQLDGTYVYLNCIYKSGFDGLVRDSNVRLKFSLTFEATDPLFYNGFETQYVITTPEDADYLMMLPVADLRHDVYQNDVPVVRSSSDVTIDEETITLYSDTPTIGGTPLRLEIDDITHNPDGVYMLPLEDAEEDDIEHNPNSLYMITANMITANELDLECQKIYPTIKITGTGANISITNDLTGRKIDIGGGTVVDGSNYILIETKPLHRKCVSVDVNTGVETSLLANLSADSTLDWYLERGLNIIKYRNSDVTPASQCAFIYTEGWLSAE